MSHMYYVSMVLGFRCIMFQRYHVSNVLCFKCIMYIFIFEREKGKGAEEDCEEEDEEEATDVCNMYMLCN